VLDEVSSPITVPGNTTSATIFISIHGPGTSKPRAGRRDASSCTILSFEVSLGICRSVTVADLGERSSGPLRRPLGAVVTEEVRNDILMQQGKGGPSAMKGI
jgi:hypothetical protein